MFKRASAWVPAGSNRVVPESLSAIGKIVIAAAIIVYLVRTQRLGFAHLGVVLQQPLHVAALLGLLLLLALVLAVRWRILLTSQGYRCSFRNVLGLTFVAIFFDSLLPGGTSDIVRGYCFDRAFQPHDRVRAASTVMVDRFLGLTGLLVLALFALSFQVRQDYDGLPALRLAISVVGVLFLLGFLFLCGYGARGRGTVVRLVSRTRAGSLCLSVFDALRNYRHRQFALLEALMLSVVGHSIVVCCFWLVGSFVGETHLSFADYLFLVPVGLCVAQIPISPGGIGVGHVGFYSLFAMAGSRLGADMFSVYIVVHFASGLPGLVYFFWRRGVSSPDINGVFAPEETEEPVWR